jgi:hypothetical protein
MCTQSTTAEFVAFPTVINERMFSEARGHRLITSCLNHTVERDIEASRVSVLVTRSAFTGTDRGLLGRFWVRGLPFPNARHLGHPSQWKNPLPWHLGPAAKVRILRFKNLPPFRHDPGLQIPRLRYSPGLAPTTRLNALLNAASDS